MRQGKVFYKDYLAGIITERMRANIYFSTIINL